MLDTSPIWGCLPICLTPHPLVSFPCAFVCFGDICMLYGEYSPYCWGFGGHLHICQALVPGSTSIGCPLGFILYFFVVHYVSHVCHDYDYYSSSYGSIFWSVIYFISDHGPFLDGASQQHWVSMKCFCYHP